MRTSRRHVLCPWRLPDGRGPHASRAAQAMIWAGEAIDLIGDIQPAANLVRKMVADAETALNRHSP